MVLEPFVGDPRSRGRRPGPHPRYALGIDRLLAGDAAEIRVHAHANVGNLVIAFQEYVGDLHLGDDVRAGCCANVVTDLKSEARSVAEKVVSPDCVPTASVVRADIYLIHDHVGTYRTTVHQQPQGHGNHSRIQHGVPPYGWSEIWAAIDLIENQSPVPVFE
ncbi:MAG TPA: hypothetical protein VFF69_05500 [Phycisphaerales bacterium]|nr:hypothetical protein [Phycisphaerales bacterium]